jgi:poly(3-hydroxybutyrate) depolymerase
VGFWRDRDACTAEPQLTNEATVSIERYDGCEGDTLVELVSLADGTHVWPSLSNGDYDASGAILQFFRLGSTS